MRAVIYAHGETITKQLEICDNFALFFDYEIVGVATEIDTLFKTPVEYDAVIVTAYHRISRNALEFQQIKNDLLRKQIIIIPAVRP